MDILAFLIVLERFFARLRHSALIIRHLFGDSGFVIVSSFGLQHFPTDEKLKPE
jgi:hypothetical protein